MTPHPHFDLLAAAKRVATENGFVVEYPADAEQELLGVEARFREHAQAAGVRDMRSILWSSIDNDDSRDLDQIEAAEALSRGRIRVLVAIAEVDALVPKGSALDRHAALNTSSLYTGVIVFPMLPDALSTGLTSLNLEEDRAAIVVDMIVDSDGSVSDADAYRAIVRNHAKLAYDEVADWLERKIDVPDCISKVPGLEEQIRLQDEAAQRLKTLRFERGALDLETLEAHAVTRDGTVIALETTRESRSRALIEDFMIAANGAMARYLDANHRSSIRRVVKKPERWARMVELAKGHGTTLPVEPSARALSEFLSLSKAKDPKHFADVSLAVVKLMGPGEYTLDRAGEGREGHFGLAVQDYTHSTAPNRRYADMVTQRLLKATMTGAPAPYTDDELAALAARCTGMENAARKVERTMRKIAAALFLQPRIGEVFDAIVTGVTPTGCFVRLLAPPAEGRVVKGERGLDVGDALKVKLVATEPSKGFIDFVTA